MPSPRSILVFGAINQDEVARVARHPLPGETVVTDSIELFPGGKGANQAYAAAVVGGAQVTVQMAGAVGDDAAGTLALQSLRSAGVDTTLVKRVVDTPTGRAYICVTEDGENTIVVGLGANAFVSPSNLLLAQRPSVAVAQTELGTISIEAFSEFAERTGARLVLNDGPVVELSAAALSYADPLVVNEHEALDLLGGQAPAGPDPAVAGRLRELFGCRSVIVTLGSRGAVLADESGTRSHPAARPPAPVVDTTGAGDSFVGALAAALALGADLDEAVTTANEAAAVSVTVRGARAPLSAITDGFKTRSTQAGVR